VLSYGLGRRSSIDHEVFSILILDEPPHYVGDIYFMHTVPELVFKASPSRKAIKR
jgi:hypothetical protein